MEKLNRAQKCSILGPQNVGSRAPPPPPDRHLTVEKMKMKLYETTEIRKGARILLDKTELDAKKSLQNHGIENFQILQMLLIPPKDITISVNIFKKGSVMVKQCLSDLRNALKDQMYSLGTAPRIYDLFLNSLLLKDEKPLHFYGIVDGSVVDLTSLGASFRVTLVDAFSYQWVRIIGVKRTDTVAKVKNKIMEVVSRDENRTVQDGDLVLYYHPLNGSVTFDELDCDALTLASMEWNCMIN